MYKGTYTVQTCCCLVDKLYIQQKQKTEFKIKTTNTHTHTQRDLGLLEKKKEEERKILKTTKNPKNWKKKN